MADARLLPDGRIVRRVQRTRIKGKPGMPEGAIYVGRPGRWGNPFEVREVDRPALGMYPAGWRVIGERGRLYRTEAEAAAHAVDLFEREARRPSWTERIADLSGRDLACWCPLDAPCHADVLLRLANPDGVEVAS